MVAQPTENLKQFFQGALLKHHLDGGIRKRSLAKRTIDAKLATWLELNWQHKERWLTKAQADVS
jgi:small subunit ribosomal protein S16